MGPLLTHETYVLLWVIAGLVAAWVLLPMVLGLLGFTRTWSECHDNPAEAEPSSDDPDYTFVYERLVVLGLVPAGSRIEHVRFLGHHWTKSFPIRMFATSDGTLFASVYRFFADDPYRVCFSTAFTDGSLVQSSNNLEVLKIQEDGYLRWGFATTDLGELLALHRDLVDQHAAAGGLPSARHDLASMDQTILHHCGRYLRRSAPATALNSLRVALMFLGIIPTTLGASLGFGSPLVPAGLLAGSLWHAFAVGSLFRLASRQIRYQEMASANRPGPDRVTR
jgi:hypothetical protein